MRLANCTMHNQAEYLAAYATLGYEVLPEPLLREVAGPEDALSAAREAVDIAKAVGAQGILLGGRTDLCIYVAIEAVCQGLKVFVAETKRERYTEGGKDFFRFNLVGVTPVKLGFVYDGYNGMGVAIPS